MRVEVAKTEYGWAYCLVDDVSGRRINPPRSVGFLWRRTAARAGRREARIRERISRRQNKDAEAQAHAKWEHT